MITRRIIIINRLGLHARAATRLVSCASAFDSEIWIGNGDKSVNGKSIMGVLTLAANKGTELVFEIDGQDENAAVESIASLIENRFGEDQ